jgi:hypothetical protein
MGVRAVFNQDQIVTTSDVCEPVQSSRIAPEVHDADGSRPRSDPSLDIVRIGCERQWIDLAEYGDATQRQHWSDGREERVGGNDHFVAGADAGREIRAVERSRSAVHEQSMRRGDGSREAALELLDGPSFSECAHIADGVPS